VHNNKKKGGKKINGFTNLFWLRTRACFCGIGWGDWSDGKRNKGNKGKGLDWMDGWMDR